MEDTARGLTCEEAPMRRTGVSAASLRAEVSRAGVLGLLGSGA